MASLAVKIAILYAAGHPKLSSQTDARSVSGSFFRPVVLSRESVSFNTHEINVGKSWSTLRVEILQTKLCVETTILCVMIVSHVWSGTLTVQSHELLNPRNVN